MSLSVAPELLADPKLPTLTRAMNTDYILQQVRSLRPGRILPGECCIENVRFKPGQKCLLYFRLTAEDGSPMPPMVARVYPQGKAKGHYEKARITGSGRVFLIPELELVAWQYPAERKLKELEVFNGGSEFVNLIEEALKGEFSKPLSLSELDMTCMHYLPELSYTVRVRGQVTSESSLSYPFTIYAKMYYDRAGARTFTVMQELQSANQGGNFVTAEPLLYSASHRLLIQKGIDLATDPSELEKNQIVSAWQEFAETDVPSAGIVLLSDLEEQLEQIFRMTNYLIPQLSSHLTCVLKRIEEKLPALDGALSGTLHGDLHPGNCLRSRSGKIAFVDLDGVKRGPVALDRGSYTAYLMNDALCREQNVKVAYEKGLNLALTATPSAARHSELRACRIATAVCLVTERYKRGITRLKASNIGHLAQLLGLAEACLSGEL